MTDTQGDERRWSDWMAAAHRGDRCAYEQLLGELAAAIEAYLRCRFGTLTFREDCVQECLLAIHHARHTYDPARPFRPWLFAVVRNTTVDLLRRSCARRSLSLESLAVVLPAHSPAPDVEVEAGDILARLKPQLRSALMLTKVIGYSLNEAAVRSGISETAMKSRVRRALKAAAFLLDSERNAG